MTDVLATQSFVLGIGEESAVTKAFSSYVLALAQYPSEDVRDYGSFVHVVGSTTNTVNVYTSVVLAVVRGADSNPKLRVWTYTLDGHDHYVLRLGTRGTLSYDTLSEQWSDLTSGISSPFGVNDGVNWNGATAFAGTYGSNVIVGSDSNGALFFLNPDADVDDDALEGAETPRTFERAIYTEIPTSGYSVTPCFGIQVRGSIGSNAGDVTLEYSDDRGNTYVSAGTVALTDEDYDTRVDWKSLGSLRAPGRIFRVTDTGALKRIDSIDLDEGG
jgi:hypothetical protein